MVQKMETRVVNLKLETRSDDGEGDNARKVSGTAVVFDQASEDLGGFTEFIDPQAFDGVDLSQVRLLYNHNFDNILSREDAGTLAITIDEAGLKFDATLPDTTLGHDVLTNIRNGNIQGCSFGFTVADDEWTDSGDGYVRKITKVDELIELSLTPIPAYTETDVSVAQRSLHKVQERREKEHLSLELALTKLKL